LERFQRLAAPFPSHLQPVESPEGHIKLLVIVI
jgi:hypothetical protein